jgi:O-antigen ligase
MGYVTWAIVGVCLCLIRWRKYLILIGVVPIAVALVLPGTAERMLRGFGDESSLSDPYVNDYEVTAGRTLIWPYVIEEITKSPVFGYGRLAMARTGVRDFLLDEYGESFPHPHNAYLEMLLDNGLLGFALVMPFYALVLLNSVRLFRDSRNPIFVAVGGVTCALVLSLLVASLGSQTFYPREGAVGMWCAIALMFRVNLARQFWGVPADAQPVDYRSQPLPAGVASAARG